MAWNYRLIHDPKWNTVSLHEVYYNDSGEPTGATLEPISFATAFYPPDGETVETAQQELIRSLVRALNNAVLKPVLVMGSDEWGKNDPPSDEMDQLELDLGD